MQARFQSNLKYQLAALKKKIVLKKILWSRHPWSFYSSLATFRFQYRKRKCNFIYMLFMQCHIACPVACYDFRTHYYSCAMIFELIITRAKCKQNEQKHGFTWE